MSNKFLCQEEIVKLDFVSGENVEQIFITRGNCQNGFLSQEKMLSKFLSEEEIVKLVICHLKNAEQVFVTKGNCQTGFCRERKMSK